MKLNEIEYISFSREGWKPHVKSPIIWGRSGTNLHPLCYLSKPKSVSDEDWNEFLDGFYFEIRKPESHGGV